MELRLKSACVGLALLAAASAHGANLYCCQDPSTGRRACGDNLPDQCRGRAYKILDGGGNVIKEVGPPLTPEQKAQAAADAQRKKEEEDALRVQRRKDQALLDTYSSVRDIDQAQARREADVQEAMKQAEAKIASLRQQRKKFEAEAEFYRNKPMPPEISKGLKDADSDIKAYTELLDAKKGELAAVRSKFEEDKKRYVQLSSGGPRAALPATGSAANTPSR